MHPGVFVVGALPASGRAIVQAAVLSCGSAAVGSHQTAGWLWGLVDREPPVVHLVMLGGRNPGPRRGVQVHRPKALGPAAIRRRDGIPLTSPVDTVLDLAASLGIDELEAVWALAVRRRLASADALRAAVIASPPRPGVANLRRLATGDPALSRSPVERALLELIRQARLPEPQTNVVVLGKEVDFWWPDARLVVEVDAFGTHGSPRSFESDRALDADLRAAGIEMLRFTRLRIRAEPEAVLARLAAVLALRS